MPDETSDIGNGAKMAVAWWCGEPEAISNAIGYASFAADHMIIALVVASKLQES